MFLNPKLRITHRKYRKKGEKMAKKTIFLTPEDDLGAIINASEPGDLIQLSEGTYRTKFTIFVNSLTIRGAGAEKPELSGMILHKKVHEDGKEQ